MRSRIRTPDANETTMIPHERLEHEDEIARYYKLTGVTLGKGSFGTVVEAVNTTDDADFVAIKKVDKSKVRNMRLPEIGNLLNTIGPIFSR